MRLLHVADLHLRWFDWVRASASRFDLLVVAGDLQDAFSDSGMVQQARVCSEWLLSLETPTVVVSGNHDYYSKSPRVTVDPTAEAQWLRRLGGKGRILAVDGESVSFATKGATLRISTNGWAQKPAWDHDTDVLVTHAPPCGVDPAREAYGSRDSGDSDLWTAMLKSPTPRLVLCGHVHNPRDFWSRWPAGDPISKTTILNPGYDDSANEPMHWVIDTALGTATHHGGDSETNIAV